MDSEKLGAGLGITVFVLLIVVYFLTDWYTAQEAVAFGTLFLALVTLLTVLHSRRQAEYMAKELEFIRRPRISVHHEGDDTGLIVFENTGQVPLEAHFGFSLEAVNETIPNSPIVDESVPYEDLPEEVKVFRGGAGDWRNKSIFLEPGDRKRYHADLLKRELEVRDSDYLEGAFLYFRIDGELETPVTDEENQPFQRLFKISLDGENATFTHISFEEAQRPE
jgi:hypothetical protein